MADKKNIQSLFDATAYDNAGDKLGSVKQVFLDDHTGQPIFIEVNHGLFGLASSLVPLRGSATDGDRLNLAFSKDAIKDAPNIDADNGLTPDEQNGVYAHYGLENSGNHDDYEAPSNPGPSNGGSHSDDTLSTRPGATIGAGVDLGSTAGGSGGAGFDPSVPGSSDPHGRLVEEADLSSQANRGNPLRTDAERNRSATAGSGDELIPSEDSRDGDNEDLPVGHVHLRKYVGQEEYRNSGSDNQAQP